jgi:kynurenine formamidase
MAQPDILDLLNKYSVIDLSHDLDEQTPVWPDGVIPFAHKMIADYNSDGYRCFCFSQSEGVGTHLDSPKHFTPGGRSVSDLQCNELIGPAVILDVREKVNIDCNHTINKSDIDAWEKQHGLIPQKAIVLGLTGWDKLWSDAKRYLNCDDNGIMHFPGFSKEAAEILLSRKISGIGIDTLSIDVGNVTKLEAHHIILGNDKYQIENLTNLDKLPPKGAIIFVMPIKIKNGAEAPARVFALIPKNY